MSFARIAAALHALRDVPGVLGSFLWAHDGRLLAVDLSPSRADALLQSVAARLQRLVQAHADAGECLESLTLRFDAYSLHICGSAGASLAVVLASPGPLPALKLALGHVLRELSQHPELGGPAPGVAMPNPHQQAAPTSARSYRGQRIVE